MTVTDIAVLLAWVAIVVLAFAMGGLLSELRALRTSGSTSIERNGPRIGSNIAGALKASGVETNDGPSYLLFASGECATCVEVAPAFEADSVRDPTHTFILVVKADDAKRLLAYGRGLVQEGGALFELMDIRVVPFAVAVARDGTIVDASPIGSIKAMRQFVRNNHSQLAVGSAAE
jgi:hypothetical protein